MISDYHRQKGGAPILGVSGPGAIGPFGPYDSQAAPDEGDHGDPPPRHRAAMPDDGEDATANAGAPVFDPPDTVTV